MERERSPNYPAYGLEASVAFARQAYSKVKRVSVPMEALARALGSSGLSGPARSKIAALRAYGLVDSTKEGFKVSERAMTLILRKPGDLEFSEAAKAAALGPALFAELAAERSEMDDENLQFYLVRDRGFSEDGARKAIKSFRETALFSSLEASDTLAGPVEASAKESGMTSTVSHRFSPSDQPTKRPGDVVFEMPGVFSARIAFASGEPSVEGIATVIEFLGLMKRQYIAKPASPNPPDEASAKQTPE